MLKISHTILYAKRWYKKSKHVYADVKKTLEADDYTPFDKKDVAMILLTETDSVNKDTRFTMIRQIDHYRFAEGMDFYDSIIEYCLSVLSLLSHDEWMQKTPDWSVLPRKNGIKDKQVTETFSELFEK